jgi:hypothetical protein
MTEQIQDYDRMGAWSSLHGFFYESAWNSFFEYQKLLERLQYEEEQLQMEYRNETPEDRASLIIYKTDKLRESCFRAAISAHLFGCLAFEGFLNLYGVKRLGEQFYKRNMERLSITNKTTLLLLMCNGVILDSESDLLKNIKYIFDIRNSLVHPKAREIRYDRLDDFVNEHPSDIKINDNLLLLDDVISAFFSFDPKLRIDLEFKKPNQ